jgi:hypothetical protein
VFEVILPIQKKKNHSLFVMAPPRANAAAARKKAATGTQKMDVDTSKRPPEGSVDEDREDARQCVGEKQSGGGGGRKAWEAFATVETLSTPQ